MQKFSKEWKKSEAEKNSKTLQKTSKTSKAKKVESGCSRELEGTRKDLTIVKLEKRIVELTSDFQCQMAANTALMNASKEKDGQIEELNEEVSYLKAENRYFWAIIREIRKRQGERAPVDEVISSLCSSRG